jgi:hypothetical protein
MAKIAFTGDPRNPGTDPAVADFFGIKFPFGEPLEVPDDIAARLRNHSHFTAGPAPVDAPKPSMADNLAKARAAKAAKNAPLKDVDA